VRLDKRVTVTSATNHVRDDTSGSIVTASPPTLESPALVSSRPVGVQFLGPSVSALPTGGVSQETTNASGYLVVI